VISELYIAFYSGCHWKKKWLVYASLSFLSCLCS